MSADCAYVGCLRARARAREMQRSLVGRTV
jgi:hypothetical protein